MSTPETGPVAAPAEPVAPLAAEPIAAAPTEVAAPAPEVALEVAPEAAPVEAAEAPTEEAAEEPVEAAPEAEPAEEVKAAEPEAAKPEAREPVAYESWKLPDGLGLDDTQNLALNGMLNEFGLSQEQGQRLVDFAAPILERAQKDLVQQQFDAFAETRRGFVKDFEKQAGNRRNTILGDARTGLGNLVPNAKDRTELLELLSFTGAGDNRLLIGAFAAHGKKLRERTAPPPANPTPPNVTAAQRRYARPR